MVQDSSEFKLKPFYWKYSLLISAFGAAWTISQLLILALRSDPISALTAGAGLFMTIAFLTAGLRNRNRIVLRISEDSVSYMGTEYPTKNISHVGLNHPGKIVLWLATDGAESRRSLNLKLIDHREHGRVYGLFSKLQARLPQRNGDEGL